MCICYDILSIHREKLRTITENGKNNIEESKYIVNERITHENQLQDERIMECDKDVEMMIVDQIDS